MFNYFQIGLGVRQTFHAPIKKKTNESCTTSACMYHIQGHTPYFRCHAHAFFVPGFLWLFATIATARDKATVCSTYLFQKWFNNGSINPETKRRWPVTMRWVRSPSLIPAANDDPNTMGKDFDKKILAREKKKGNDTAYRDEMIGCDLTLGEWELWYASLWKRGIICFDRVSESC